MRTLITLILLLIHGPSISADIFYSRGSPERLETNSGNRPPPEWFPRIILVGEIAPGDDGRFSEALEKARKDGLKWWSTFPHLMIDSAGGDVTTAMAIGRLVRKSHLHTQIQSNGTCASACVLVFAGGVSRYAPERARIGLHRPHFTNAAKATASGYESFHQSYSSVLKSHRAYFAEMGISLMIVDLMEQVPSNEIMWLNRNTASSLQITGEDAAYSEWQRAQRMAKRGSACVAWEDTYFNCIASASPGVPGVLARCEALAGDPPSNCE